MTPDCIHSPWTPGCERFEIPSSQSAAAVSSLCGMMDWMPGCTVSRICANPAVGVGSHPFCDPFAQWADVCRFDMPGMKGCAEYRDMCGNKTSIVQQCLAHPPLPYLPTTKEARTLVTSICTEMSMDGCELCTSGGQCDWFGVYSRLCVAMPEMEQCRQFEALCHETSEFPLCPGAEEPEDPSWGRLPPVMKMYFHFGISEYILFKPWAPHTAVQYVISCVFLFGFAVGYEWVLHFQKRWERRNLKRYQELLVVSRKRGVRGSGLDQGSASSSRVAETQGLLDARPALAAADGRMEMARIRFKKAGLRIGSSCVGYSLMLVWMTYNVGLCVSVVLGYGVGSFMFYFEGLEVGDVVGDVEGGEEDCCGSA
ncbi:hypothetical protein HDU98_008931 [Podochytrium sp. JEL0797]|nr:hypothetical protein HDU98_008931 [Podochytrium sp. JEL0797]